MVPARGNAGGDLAVAFSPGEPMVNVPGLKVFRRSAPDRKIDYFFMVNSGRAAVSALLLVGEGIYSGPGMQDAVSGQEIHCSPTSSSPGIVQCNVDVPAHGAVWLRAQLV